MVEHYEVSAVRSGEGWALWVPELPGAISRTRTLVEAEDSIRDAIAEVLAVEPDSFSLHITAKRAD